MSRDRIIQSCYSFCILRGWHNVLHMHFFPLVFEWLIPCAFSPINPYFTLLKYITIVHVCACAGMLEYQRIPPRTRFSPFWGRVSLVSAMLCTPVQLAHEHPGCSVVYTSPIPKGLLGLQMCTTDSGFFFFFFLREFWKPNPNCWTWSVSNFTHRGILPA